jgi:hypothetical protein
MQPPPIKPAQVPSPPEKEISQKAWAAGVGAGFYQYWSVWEYYYYYDGIRQSSVNWHIFPRLLFLGFIENNSLFRLGSSISIGLRADVLYGLIGGTNWDGEPDDLTISTGGSSYGADVILKFMYHTPSVIPYVGFGPQFIVFSSNGEGSELGYKYDDPWTEYIFAIPICLGIEIGTGNLVFSIEYQRTIVLSGTTDWDPGREPWFYEMTSGNTLLARIGFRL